MKNLCGSASDPKPCLRKCRNSIVRSVIILGMAGLAVALISSCANLPPGHLQAISKGPYLQAPGARTMTVMWESLTNHPESRVS